MSKAEHIFESADFSGETDFKERLRVQLFDDNSPASSELIDQNADLRFDKKETYGRILSFDELEMVSAAGDSTSYRNQAALKTLGKSNIQPGADTGTGWGVPVQGIDPSSPKSE